MAVPEFYEALEITVTQTEDRQVGIMPSARLVEVLAVAFMEASFQGGMVEAGEIMRQAARRLTGRGLFVSYGVLEDHSPVMRSN